MGHFLNEALDRPAPEAPRARVLPRAVYGFGLDTVLAADSCATLPYAPRELGAIFGIDPDTSPVAAYALSVIENPPPSIAPNPLVQAFQRAYNAAGNLPSIDEDGKYGRDTAAALAFYGAAPPAFIRGGAREAVSEGKAFGSRGSASGKQFLPSVLAAFVPLTSPLEGNKNFLYQDSSKDPASRGGWVTTGIGNMVDDVAGQGASLVAMHLPWQINGRPASEAEIVQQFQLVKANTNSALKSSGAQSIPGNTMRLPEAAVDKLVGSVVKVHISTLANLFPNVLSWPADAQLGLLGVTWGNGPNLRSVPRLATLVRAIDANDFDALAHFNWKRYWNNINADRMKNLQILFANAADSVKHGFDRTFLHWPTRFSLRGTIAAAREMLPTAIQRHAPSTEQIASTIEATAEVAVASWVGYAAGAAIFLGGYLMYKSLVVNSESHGSRVT